MPENVCERDLFVRDALGRLSLPRSGEVGERGPGLGPGLGGRVELEDEEEVVAIVW